MLGGVETSHEGRSGGAAVGRGTICLGEADPPASKGIEVRCQRLRSSKIGIIAGLKRCITTLLIGHEDKNIRHTVLLHIITPYSYNKIPDKVL